MAVFSSDEVFQMAAQLEASGQDFYQILAEECPDVRIASLARHLAQQEAEHLATFKEMRKAVASRPASRPLTWDELGFAQMMIEDRVAPTADDARRMAAEGGFEEILDLAVQMEKDSVLFYTEVLQAMDPSDATAICKIIDEEKRHLAELLGARRTGT